MKKIVKQIESLGVVPVVVIEEAENAPKLAEALMKADLPCAEITFRTAAAEDAIKRIAQQNPDMLLGAGTVLTVAQAQKAAAAGAKFIVTPGFDEAVVDWCLANQIMVVPGVATPTEINLALNKVIEVLKFFPAEAMGGVRMLKAISGPYPHVKFIPTGGINPDNFADYLALPQVLACGGSWLVKKTLISAGEFEKITTLTQQARQIVESVRS